MEIFNCSGRGFYTKAVEWGRSQLNGGMISDEDLNYCVLNNIRCGDFRNDSWDILKKPSQRRYHILINGTYNDPDLYSEILYVLAAYKFSERAKAMGFSDLRFTIDKRPFQSAFCLVAKRGEECIQTLGGDWIINWDDVYDVVNAFSKDSAYKLIKKLHTIQWHAFWPCYKVNGHNTVNQSRVWISA